jgi:hypothetical protein
VTEPEKKPERGWLRHKYGSGDTFSVARGLYLEVSYDSGELPYRVRVFGADMIQRYASSAEAKLAAEAYAKRLCSHALNSITLYGVGGS